MRPDLLGYLIPLTVVFHSCGLTKANDICIIKGHRKLQIKNVWTQEYCTNGEEASGNYHCDDSDLTIIRRECMCNYMQFFRLDGKGYCPDHRDVRFNNMFCNECTTYGTNGPCGDRGTFNCTKVMPNDREPLAANIECICKKGLHGKYCDYEEMTLSCRQIINNTKSTCDIDNLTFPCIAHNTGGKIFFNCHSESTTMELKECKDVTKDDLNRDISTVKSGQNGSNHQSSSGTMTKITVPFFILVLITVKVIV